MIRASGVGSWPGESIAAVMLIVRDLLTEAGVPYLPELPGRGPGADLIGRGAVMLTDLAVTLEPSGWRFAGRPGRDAGRAAAYLREDLDELAAAYEGYAGSLKIQATGPWTLAASIELANGQVALRDSGARADIVSSLTHGLGEHVQRVQDLVPDAEVIVQLDEPSIVAVLRGEVPTASGFGRVAPVDQVEVTRGLAGLAQSLPGPVIVHCCHPQSPLDLLRDSGIDGLSLDLASANPRRWDEVLEVVESGPELWAGVVSTSGNDRAPHAAPGVAGEPSVSGHRSLETFEEDLVVTPACGLAGLTPTQARSAQQRAVTLARELTEQSPS